MKYLRCKICKDPFTYEQMNETETEFLKINGFLECSECINELMDKENKDINLLEKELKKYKKGFNILIEYFDSISDEEKPKVDKQLKRIGL